MRYKMQGLAAGAIVAGLIMAFTVVAVLALADDPNPEVLSGTELTIEDWQECLAFLNEGRARNGEPTTTALPTLIDGEWRFAQGGDFYSCSGGRVIPTPES